MNSRRFALLSMLSGIILIVLFVIMLTAGGNPAPAAMPNEPGFTGAVYWFEVVESSNELFLVLGDAESEAGRELRQSMDLVNRIDYGFMTAYSFYFALLFLFICSMIRGRRTESLMLRLLVAAGLVLSVVMLVGDIMENVQLLALTGFENIESVDTGVIASLMLFTRVKWFAIFAASLLVALFYRLYFGRSLACLLFGLLYVVSAVLGILSFAVHEWRFMLEYSGLLLGAAWLISAVYSGMYFFRGEVE